MWSLTPDFRFGRQNPATSKNANFFSKFDKTTVKKNAVDNFVLFRPLDLFALFDIAELEVWKETRSANSPMDLMVPPDFQTELKMRMEEADIQYDVIISDLQSAINNENPNVTVSGDDFENRFSKFNSSVQNVTK